MHQRQRRAPPGCHDEHTLRLRAEAEGVLDVGILADDGELDPQVSFATSAAKSSAGGFSMPSPSEYRRNAWIFTSPPSFFPSSWRSLSMVPAGGSHTLSWPRSVTSVNHLPSLPSVILGHACSGFPSSLSWAT